MRKKRALTWRQELSRAKADLRDWGLGDGHDKLVRKIQLEAASIVLEELYNDLNGSDPHLELDGNQLIISVLSGDWFRVELNVTGALSSLASAGEIDNSTKLNIAKILRHHAKKLEVAATKDHVADDNNKD